MRNVLCPTYRNLYVLPAISLHHLQPSIQLKSIQAFDVVLGPVGQEMDDLPPEDASPSIEKVYQDQDGHWVITDVTGLKLGVRWRLDGQGYDIVKSGYTRSAPL